MPSFTKLKVATRLHILVFLALLGLTGLCVANLIQLKDSMLQDRKTKLQNLVQLAVGTASHYQELAAAGKLSEADAQTAAKDALRKLRYSKDDYFFALDPQGAFVFHGVKPALEGKNMMDAKDARGSLYVRDLVAAAQRGGDFVPYWFPKPGSTSEFPKLSYSGMFAPWNWAIGTGIYIDDIDTEFRQSALVSGGISLVLLVALVFVGWLISSSILRQLGGEPADAANIMQKIADGDLTVSTGTPPEHSMLATLAKMVLSLKELVAGINQSSDQVVSSAEHISTASKEVATAAGLQVDATASIAAAIEELTVSSNHISDSARETRIESETSLRASTEGHTRVEQVTNAIQHIADTVSEASTRINALKEKANEVTSIASVIKEIAAQTNLLALNAAIEAARAGEQGRGFAVVADEVRKLAERTTTATSEIETMLAGIQSETATAVDIMQTALPEVAQGVELGVAASTSLLSIEESSKRNLSRIGEVADATREQSDASTSIAQRVEQIAQMVDETSATIRSTADTAEHLEVIAQDLKDKVRRFRM